MRLRAVLAALLTGLLAGCGDGYFVGYGFGTGFDDNSFIVWSGNAGYDHVADASNHTFAFYSDNGCLYNFQTGRENRSFCLASGQDTVSFGSFRIRIVNIRAVDGTCNAALLDEATGNLIDIQLDQRANEVVTITTLHPVACVA